MDQRVLNPEKGIGIQTTHPENLVPVVVESRPAQPRHKAYINRTVDFFSTIKMNHAGKPPFPAPLFLAPSRPAGRYLVRFLRKGDDVLRTKKGRRRRWFADFFAIAIVAFSIDGGIIGRGLLSLVTRGLGCCYHREEGVLFSLAITITQQLLQFYLRPPIHR